MRYYPDDEYSLKDLAKLNAPDWMVELLKLNPDYICWGPHEDYMCKKGTDWDSVIANETWEEFGPWELDEYNECVNFYFEINRESKKCTTCGSNGYNPDAQWVSESFYQYSSPFYLKSAEESALEKSFGERFCIQVQNSVITESYPNKATLAKYNNAFRKFCSEMLTDIYWCDKIVQEEVDALIEKGRIRDNPTVEEVNGANGRNSRLGSYNHDAINRSILVGARCKRFGIEIHCPECSGDRYVFTAPNAHLSLILWMLHPRKGASRGVEIKHVKQENLPGVFKFLKCAAERNTKRFEKVVVQNV